MLILGYRALAMFFDPGQVTGVFELSAVQVLTYAVGSVLPVLASFGFLLMCTERSQRELRHAAGTDYLTGCFNRRAIEQHGTRAGQKLRKHVILAVHLGRDLDGLPACA